MSLRVAAFYRFAAFAADELPRLRAALLHCAATSGVRGTVLLATEGINGTVSGPPAGVEELLSLLRSDPRLAALEVKDSSTTRQPFHRLKVRLKREIVTMGQPNVAPYLAGPVGTHVPAPQWDALIHDPTTLVIDTRNSYEVAIGSFTGAIDPHTASFSDFPAWVDTHLRPLVETQQPERIALFCTGGIRCEKATSYLIQQGFKGVHHLQGGILSYLEAVPEAGSSWQGECFVFDQRVAVNHQLEPGQHSLCHACGLPLTPADRDLPSYLEGVSCLHCLNRFSAADRERFAERQRQMQLARGRGVAHLGPQPA